MFAVKATRKIEQKYFQQLRIRTEHRPDAEARHAVMGADRVFVFQEGGARGVDAEGGLQIAVEPQIGGGEAQLAAATVAMLHPRLDAPEMAEQLRGLFRPPLRQ